MGDAAFWARKRLADLPPYRVVTTDASAAEAASLGLPLAAGEVLLGVYTNPPGTTQSHVAITSTAIAVRGADAWERVAYAAMSVLRLRGDPGDWDSAAIMADGGAELVVHMPYEPIKPVTALSGYLHKVSPIRSEVVDRSTFERTWAEAMAWAAGVEKRVAETRQGKSREATAVMALPTPAVPQPVG